MSFFETWSVIRSENFYIVSVCVSLCHRYKIVLLKETSIFTAKPDAIDITLSIISVSNNKNFIIF